MPDDWPSERFRETDHMRHWSFRGATEGGEPGIHSLGPWLWFRARRIRPRVYPRSALYDAHIGNSRCAAAPWNDAAYDLNHENASLALDAELLRGPTWR